MFLLWDVNAKFAFLPIQEIRGYRSGAVVCTQQGNFVIDTSPEIRLQLLREHVKLVHAAIFTHAHADHIFGLDDLRLFGYKLDRSIPLYCEAEVEKALRMSFHYAFTNLEESHPYALPRFEFKRIESEPFELLGMEIQPIRLMHGKLPILGFRMGTFAFCTDVSFIPEGSWALLQDLDVLVIGALREEKHPTHFSINEALEVIESVQPKRAYLTHLSHKLDYATLNAQLPEHVEPAYDGLKIPLHLA